MDGALTDNEDDDCLTEREKDIQTAVRAVASQGLTYREASGFVEFGKDWVGDRYREWKDGEHVNVVGFGPADIEV